MDRGRHEHVEVGGQVHLTQISSWDGLVLVALFCRVDFVLIFDF